ncbi:MAG: hypothetical protein CSA96_09690 [Bacteroidetes bacterium]|nr:MAG: hypothetical protein CSA96_09690 [Bacteroidota bacterium]
MASSEIKPITMPGVHSRVYRYLQKYMAPSRQADILDVGAGHGAFSLRLHEDGYRVSACDFMPDHFHVEGIECRWADVTKALPYEDASFDVVMVIEVMEHVHDHQVLFEECYRVLRPGGMLFFSTPNIMSLKSRWRFLFCGYFYAFKPLDYARTDGLQHTASLTVDQYRHLAVSSGFERIELDIDKRQKSSRLLAFLIPFIRLSSWRKGYPYQLHNRYDLLTGRLLFFRLHKPSR